MNAIRKGQTVQLEYVKANSYTHRTGTVEKVDQAKGFITLRVSTLPLEFRTFKADHVYNLQIIN